jgi:hypothetical protein
VPQEVDPAHQLHGEEPALVLLHQLPQAHQVVVAQIGQRAELVLQAQQHRPVEIA